VGPVRQRNKRKEKEEPGAWAAAGRRLVGCWAAGPEGGEGMFSFFLFPFQTLFKTTFKLKFKSNLFKLFTEFL
jgi:hypothetical protein